MWRQEYESDYIGCEQIRQKSFQIQNKLILRT